MPNSQMPVATTSRYTTAADHVMMIFWEKFENDQAEFVEYLHHCGIDLGELSEAVESGWPAIEALILGHYRVRPGVYDLEQVGQHLATYPPIAARIRELRRPQIHKERQENNPELRPERPIKPRDRQGGAKKVL
jgi:hypothetical protein